VRLAEGEGAAVVVTGRQRDARGADWIVGPSHFWPDGRGWERASSRLYEFFVPDATLHRRMKVGPDTGSRPTSASHLNGGIPRTGLLKPLHASPGLGANAFSPLLATLNPYD
jgi:hypothetical protein